MTAALAARIGSGRSVTPRRLTRRRPVHGVPEGGVLVREEEVDALVADVMMARAARGKDVTVTPEAIVWLYRGAVVMLGAFEPGLAAEENDG